jgi:hypothetical protein
MKRHPHKLVADLEAPYFEGYCRDKKIFQYPSNMLTTNFSLWFRFNRRLWKLHKEGCREGGS